MPMLLEEGRCFRRHLTWRFRGSYKWGYKVLYDGLIATAILLLTLLALLMTNHEPPSMQWPHASGNTIENKKQVWKALASEAS